MKFKLIGFSILCTVGIIILIAYCFHRSPYERVTFCHPSDGNDCVDFLIPSEFPNFVSEYGDTLMGMPGMVTVSLMWCSECADEDRDSDGVLRHSTFYGVTFVVGSSLVSEFVPFSLYYDSDKSGKSIERFFLYNAEGIPEEVEAKEWYCAHYEIEGYECQEEEPAEPNTQMDTKEI